MPTAFSALLQLVFTFFLLLVLSPSSSSSLSHLSKENLGGSILSTSINACLTYNGRNMPNSSILSEKGPQMVICNVYRHPMKFNFNLSSAHNYAVEAFKDLVVRRQPDGFFTTPLQLPAVDVLHGITSNILCAMLRLFMASSIVSLLTPTTFLILKSMVSREIVLSPLMALSRDHDPKQKEQKNLVTPPANGQKL